jgi:hypothetical protein
MSVICCSFEEGDEGVECGGYIPGAGVSFSTSFVDDDSGVSVGVGGLDCYVVDPAGEVEAGVVFDLYGRPIFVGDPKVASVKICSGRYTLRFDTSDVQVVADCTFGR